MRKLLRLVLLLFALQFMVGTLAPGYLKVMDAELVELMDLWDQPAESEKKETKKQKETDQYNSLWAPIKFANEIEDSSIAIIIQKWSRPVLELPTPPPEHA